MGIPQRPKRDAASTFIAAAVKDEAEEEKTVITLRISKAMVKKVDDRAKELGISRTALMLLATNKMLEGGL